MIFSHLNNRAISAEEPIPIASRNYCHRHTNLRELVNSTYRHTYNRPVTGTWGMWLAVVTFSAVREAGIWAPLLVRRRCLIPGLRCLIPGLRCCRLMGVLVTGLCNDCALWECHIHYLTVLYVKLPFSNIAHCIQWLHLPLMELKTQAI